MKLYRFKKEFAHYARTRSGDDTLPLDFVMVFDEEDPPSDHSHEYALNYNGIWAFLNELDEVNDPKIIQAYEKEMRQDVEVLLKNTNPKNRLGSFAFKDVNGVFKPTHGIACHYSFDGTGKTDACTWNLFLLKERQKKPIRELVEWMVNFSPWMHCIATRWDILSCQERTDRAMEGPVPLNMEAPVNEVVGFAVALRVITEHEWVIPTYLKLRELGASRAIAFMLTAFVQHDEDKGIYVFYPNGDWHHFLNCNQSVPDLCKFFKQGYFLENRSKHKFKDRRYNSVAGQVARKDGKEDSFSCVIAKHTKKKGVGFAAISSIDIESLLEEVNQTWSKA